MADDTQQPAGNWFDGFEPEIKGYLQNRGLDKLDPAAAFLKTAEAHRLAEKRLGAPSDELVRFPKDPNDAAWADVHKRLGRPDDVTGYDFSTVKHVDGKDFDAGLAGALREAALQGNVPAGAALRIAEAMAKHMDIQAATTAERSTQAAALENELLRNNWGPNYETNRFMASKGAEILGFTPEQVAAMERSVGGAKVMEGFLKAGMATGEARQITGVAETGTRAVSADQAVSRLEELKADRGWAQKWMSGDAAAKTEFESLTRQIAEARYNARMARR
jgi:hypothetical protein